MVGCCFGDAVHDCAVLADVGHGCACRRGDDDYARGRLTGAGALEKGREAVGVRDQLCSRLNGDAYSRARLKTPRTLRSSTFLLDQSGVGSKGPPHVAPALHTRMSNLLSVSCTFFTSLSMSSVSATLAAMPTAVPDTGSLLSLSTAWSMPCSPSFLRAEMKTFFAPASRNAVAVWRPRPLEPSEED